MSRILLILLSIVAGCRGRGDDGGFRAPPAPNVQVTLCAAYPYEPAKTHAVVIQRDGTAGDIVTWHGGQFNVHRSDCLALAGPELREIGWAARDDGFYVNLHLAGELADRLEQRTEQRMSQFDAVFAAGSLYTVAPHEHVLSEWLGFVDRDGAKQRALFKQLTGVAPPP